MSKLDENMDGWKIERQTQSLSQSQTRVLQSHTQNLRLNFTQTFPSIMDGFEDRESLDTSDAIKKKFEKMSFAGLDEMSLRPMQMQMPMQMSGFGDPNFNKLLGGSGLMGESVVTSVRSEKTQMFAASRSATLQSQSSVSGSAIPTSNTWMNMSSDVQQGLAATVSEVTNVSTSGAAVAGVTRSFSTSSGFPIAPASFNRQLSNTDSSLNSPVENNVSIPSLENFVSPFRRPFGFRNFDRPLWTDMASDFKDNQNFRMTWDPSTLPSMKSSSSHLQFSASQRSVFQSVNGSFRAYKDQRVLLRQSYGASESESEDEDDDNDIKMLMYEPKKGLPYQPKLAICDKPQYPPSEIDDTSSVGTLEPDDQIISRITGEPGSEPITPEHRRCHKVAQELLTTERTYVRILHLIDQVFHFRVDQENRVQSMFPPETVTQMFCNIKSLYKLHNDHLLPQLEKRLSEWQEDNPRIGDIMKDFAPFLKMYSEYVQNFDNSINLINIYKEKSSRFSNIINEIQKMEECANLPIQHHLIGPIQRIPRYRLLLEAYLRKLPETSPDHEDTKKALEIVSKAAEHANEAMRRIASFKKLLEVQEQVKGAVDLVSPTRVLVREGKISKISARSSDHQERYIFLFSDMVLLCSIRPMANRMISSAPYQLRAKLDVAEMTVNEGDDLEVANTFYIQDQQKRIELYTQTSEEKKHWMEAMWQARMDLMERKSSLRLGSISPSEEDLGLKEPAKIKSETVSKCMECHTAFSMLKRRHHCHACGSVVCAKCSGAKVPLQYAGGKLCRVCKTCKNVLDERGNTAAKNGNPSPSSPDDSLEKVKGVLDVPASAPAVFNGNLNLRLRGKKEWTARWFVLRRDFVLYCYAKDTDHQAMTATPMPGMNVHMADSLPKSETNNLPSSERERAFRIAHEHGRKVFLFLATNREEAIRWVQILQSASKAELNGVNANGNESNQP
ncbi:unnamed protein product [Allacma fusca]|uniref:Uncharacterized protein n=1 Tax=Allacma fusca TaxID=39272 RepID=A0A8J2JGN9_9HEXA|nr:unnamed protein product [Allacma fusca]